jgi:histidinol-phosphate aminotransferase
VRTVPPYVTARSQHRGGTLLDANENAFGPATTVVPTDLHRYPDPTNGELRRALADRLGVPGERLWLGNGSDEAIDLLVRSLVEPGDPVAIVEPSYGVYAQRVAAHGGVGRGIGLDAGFDLDVGRTVKAARDCSLLFLCSPNNPTGNRLSRERMLEVVRRTRCVVAVDEAYVEFAPTGSSLVDVAGGDAGPEGLDRLAILRTFSKAWGLAGARVGYLVAHPVLVRAVDRIGLPYPLSALSAHAASKALEEAERMERTRDALLAERRRLAAELELLGLEVLPSDANFLLFFVPDPAETQRRLADEHGVVIRDRSRMPGLAGALRVTVGTPDENERFLAALREVL